MPRKYAYGPTAHLEGTQKFTNFAITTLTKDITKRKLKVYREKIVQVRISWGETYSLHRVKNPCSNSDNENRFHRGLDLKEMLPSP